MTSLVIAEHDNASIKPATLNTVTAAAACGGDVNVLVAGEGAAAAAQAASQIAGLIVARYVLRLPDLAEAPAEELVVRVGATVQRYLFD